jgi:hypothetical protein
VFSDVDFFPTEFGNRPQENWNEDTIGEIDMKIANSYVHREESSRGQNICKSPSEYFVTLKLRRGGRRSMNFSIEQISLIENQKSIQEGQIS